MILPAPGLALAFAAGGSLSPLLVGLAVGSGSAVGELTGYLAGVSGRGVIENQARYDQIRGWMRSGGLWVIFFLSLVPNPLFDIAGITAGAMRIPVWKFLAATWGGKVIKATLDRVCRRRDDEYGRPSDSTVVGTLMRGAYCVLRDVSYCVVRFLHSQCETTEYRIPNTRIHTMPSVLIHA